MPAMLAILLAAGRGRRLGRPKTLVELGGRSALLRCVEALAEGGATPIRVVLAPGADAERHALDAAAADLAFRFRAVTEVVVNPRPERGQSSSLRCALAAGPPPADGFLLHTVDHPLLAPADVSALRTAFALREPHHAIVLPLVLGRRGHPAVFAAALVREFLELGEDEPAHFVVRRDEGRILGVARDNPWLVRDIDTPEDLALALAALGGRAGPRDRDMGR